jgi:hypothetical protein
MMHAKRIELLIPNSESVKYWGGIAAEHVRLRVADARRKCRWLATSRAIAVSTREGLDPRDSAWALSIRRHMNHWHDPLPVDCHNSREMP